MEHPHGGAAGADHRHRRVCGQVARDLVQRGDGGHRPLGVPAAGSPQVGDDAPSGPPCIHAGRDGVDGARDLPAGDHR